MPGDVAAVEPMRARARRLREKPAPTIVDLFSGCGGMTLGFHSAGFHPLAGVEMDRFAARSHALNFHPEMAIHEPDRFERLAAARDITRTDPASLLGNLGYDDQTQVDVIIGGPPCPAFTRVGRAKLREVHQHPEAFKQDPRWKLYVPYLNFVETLRPAALVMENVPDLMNFGGHNLAEEIADELDVMGYEARYTLLNAAHYGVPQMRDRFILIAFDKKLGVIPAFPKPTHHLELPRGYQSSRSVAMRTLRTPDGQLPLSGVGADPELRFIPLAIGSPDAPPAVTVAEAIGDLPFHVPAPQGRRRLDQAVPYPRSVAGIGKYAHLMRTWQGFGTEGGVTAHVTRALKERDYRIFERMAPGDDYPAAHRIATRLLEQELAGHPEVTPEQVQTLKAQYVPPYDPGKFPNKWRKMDPGEPARTLMAHLGKDSYTHIHYDSKQRRVLTVREAARLQSFPDGFEFFGSMNPGFRQIGNAVPPLLAKAVATSVRSQLLRALARLPDN